MKRVFVLLIVAIALFTACGTSKTANDKKDICLEIRISDYVAPLTLEFVNECGEVIQ